MYTWYKLKSCILLSRITFFRVKHACHFQNHFLSRQALRNVSLERFSRAGPRGREREWPTLGVHPLSWLLSNNPLEKVPFVSVLHTSSNRLLLSNQDKGCTPSVAHSLPLPLGPALLNLWITIHKSVSTRQWKQVDYVLWWLVWACHDGEHSCTCNMCKAMCSHGDEIFQKWILYISWYIRLDMIK